MAAKVIRTDVIFDDNTIILCYPLEDGTDPPLPPGTPNFILKKGHTLFLDAPNTLLPGTNEHKDLFSWNFGDTSTGSKYNTTRGFNAAHLYDTPGTYTITLTHTVNGLTASPGTPATTTWVVQVTDPTQQDIYVSNSAGSDTNTGTIGSPLKSITAALSRVNAYDRIYLKAGDTWQAPAAGYTIEKDGVEIRSYGTGSLPVIVTAVYANGSVFKVEGADVVIRNVYFRQLDPGYTLAGTRAVLPQRPNLTLYNCWTQRMVGLINGDIPAPVVDGDPVVDGVLLLECQDEPGEQASRNQWVFGAYNRWCLYGCKAYDSIYGATVFFQGRGFNKVAINGGELGNRDGSITRYGTGGIVQNANNLGKGAIILAKGSYAWVDGVTFVSDVKLFSDGAINLGPLGKGDVDLTAIVDHVVFYNNLDRSYERNRTDDSQPVQIILYPGLHYASVVNNTDFQLIYVAAYDASSDRRIQNVFIRGDNSRNAIRNYSPDAVTFG